jgi:hypothetical protein
MRGGTLREPSATSEETVANFNPENVFEQFSENIPDGGEHVEAYLSAIARRAKEARLPVSADVTEERVGGGFRAERTMFVVLTPTEKRLHRYPSYHYGKSVGSTLNVGWYLIGKVASGGLGGWAIAGGASQRDMDDLEALMAAIHESAVVPAMHETAAAGGLTTGNRPRQGLFGAG